MKATLHWVSAAHAVDGEVRLYDRLFTAEDPDGAAAKAGTDFSALLNPASLEVLTGCKLEPMLAAAARRALPVRAAGLLRGRPRRRAGAPVFNRTVSLKDTWLKNSPQSRVDS